MRKKKAEHWGEKFIREFKAGLVDEHNNPITKKEKTNDRKAATSQAREGSKAEDAKPTKASDSKAVSESE